MAGFLSRLFGGAKPEPARATAPSPAPARATQPPASPPSRSREVSITFREDLEVAGENYYRESAGKIFRGLGRPEGGVTMQTAHLIPEPNNKYDRDAVRVLVQGHQVGHVPREASASIAKKCAAVGRGNTATVSARIWATNDNGTWRSRVTLMFSGERESEKDYAAERREAAAYTAERDAERARKDAEKAEREAQKEARRVAGNVDGQYWPLLKPSISELKRQKRFEEARDLLAKCIDASERESLITGEVPDPWPTDQISVVLRRLREYPAELAYLQRYVAACGDREVPESVTMRLNRSKLTAERGGEAPEDD